MLPADAPDPAAVLTAFGLDGEVLSCEPVPGGWSNRVLRLRTAEHDLAVKQVLNPWGVARWRGWLAEGWRLEQAAIAAGVPAPEPVLAPDGGCLVLVRSLGGGEVPVRAHRWAAGATTVPREPVDDGLATWVGDTLAVVQSLELAPLDPSVYADRLGATTAEVWPDLVARARAAGAPWSEVLAGAEPLARRASALMRPDEDDDVVLVHGDLDQKNLLLTPAGPLLCDWDVVLPLARAAEVSHAAVTMAGWARPDAARAVLQGWSRRSGVAPVLEPHHLGPALASRLGWIRFQVDRALAGEEPGLDLEPLVGDLARRLAVAEDWPAWAAGA